MEQLPRFKPGQDVPAFAKTQVTAGRFVKIVDTKTAQGDYQIGQCDTAGEHAFGVAEQDSAPTTQPSSSVERRVNVTKGSIARVLAGADINVTTAAVPVKTDASGRAIPQAGTGEILGYALHTADFDAGDYVEVDLIN